MTVPASYDRERAREYVARHYHPGPNGRTSVWLTCPFCETEFRANVWSLSGSGKKCPRCGAIHGARGLAFPLTEKAA